MATNTQGSNFTLGGLYSYKSNVNLASAHGKTEKECLDRLNDPTNSGGLTNPTAQAPAPCKRFINSTVLSLGVRAELVRWRDGVQGLTRSGSRYEAEPDTRTR